MDVAAHKKRKLTSEDIDNGAAQILDDLLMKKRA